MAILGTLCTFLVVAALLGLLVFALIQFSQLKTRLQKLERDVNKLRTNVSATEIVAEAESVPVVLPVPAAARHGERKTRHKLPPVDTAGPDWTKIEAWLGVRALGWAAVVLLLITAAFFLKLVFELGLIGELGRAMVGVSVGTALCIGGWFCHRRGQSVFCQMLTSAGIALLYL